MGAIHQTFWPVPLENMHEVVPDLAAFPVGAPAEEQQNCFTWNIGGATPAVGRGLRRLGVRVATAVVRVIRAILDLLFETSADVGEWYLSRLGGYPGRLFRSRHS